jgi:hypothetical protein
MSTALRDETTAPVAGRWRYGVWLLLGLLVVAHGCHRDRDTELFTRLRLTVGVPGPPAATSGDVDRPDRPPN